jgi:hypothetical protein
LKTDPGAVHKLMEAGLRPEMEKVRDAAYANAVQQMNAATPQMRSDASDAAGTLQRQVADTTLTTPAQAFHINNGAVDSENKGNGLNPDAPLPTAHAPTSPRQVTGRAQAVQGTAQAKQKAATGELRNEQNKQGQSLGQAVLKAGFGGPVDLGSMAIQGYGAVPNRADPTANSGALNSFMDGSGVGGTFASPPPTATVAPSPQSGTLSSPVSPGPAAGSNTPQSVPTGRGTTSKPSYPWPSGSNVYVPLPSSVSIPLAQGTLAAANFINAQSTKVDNAIEPVKFFFNTAQRGGEETLGLNQGPTREDMGRKNLHEAIGNMRK